MFNFSSQFIMRLDHRNSVCVHNTESLEVLDKLLSNTVSSLKIQNNFNPYERMLSDSLGLPLHNSSKDEISKVLVRLIEKKWNENITLLFYNIKEYYAKSTELVINSESIKLLSSMLIFVLIRFDSEINFYDKLKEFSLQSKGSSVLNQHRTKSENEKINVINWTNNELLAFIIECFINIKSVIFSIQSDFGYYDERFSFENDYRMALVMLHLDWLLVNLHYININNECNKLLRSLVDLDAEEALFGNNTNPDDYFEMNGFINDFESKKFKQSFHIQPMNFSIMSEGDFQTPNILMLNTQIGEEGKDAVNTTIVTEKNCDLSLIEEKIEPAPQGITTNSKASSCIAQNILTFYLINRFMSQIDFRCLKLNVPYSFYSETIELLKQRFKEHKRRSKDLQIKDEFPLDENFSYLYFLERFTSLKVLEIGFNSLDFLSFINILGVLSNNKLLRDLNISLFVKDQTLYSFSFLQHLCNTLNVPKIGGSTPDINEYLLKLLPSFELNLELLLYYIYDRSISIKHLILEVDLPNLLLECPQYSMCVFKFIIGALQIGLNNYSQIETLSLSSAGFPIDPHKYPILNSLFKINEGGAKKYACLKSLKLNLYFFNFININEFINLNIECLELESLDACSFLSLYSNLESFISLRYILVKLIGYGFEQEINIFINFFKCKKPKSLACVKLLSKYEIDDAFVVGIIENSIEDCVEDYYVEVSLNENSVIYTNMIFNNPKRKSSQCNLFEEYKMNMFSINYLGKEESEINKAALDKSLKSLFNSNCAIEFSDVNSFEISGLKCKNKRKYSRLNEYSPEILGYMILSNRLKNLFSILSSNHQDAELESYRSMQKCVTKENNRAKQNCKSHKYDLYHKSITNTVMQFLNQKLLPRKKFQFRINL